MSDDQTQQPAEQEPATGATERLESEQPATQQPAEQEPVTGATERLEPEQPTEQAEQPAAPTAVEVKTIQDHITELKRQREIYRQLMSQLDGGIRALELLITPGDPNTKIKL